MLSIYFEFTLLQIGIWDYLNYNILISS